MVRLAVGSQLDRVKNLYPFLFQTTRVPSRLPGTRQGHPCIHYTQTTVPHRQSNQMIVGNGAIGLGFLERSCEKTLGFEGSYASQGQQKGSTLHPLTRIVVLGDWTTESFYVGSLL